MLCENFPPLLPESRRPTPSPFSTSERSKLSPIPDAFPYTTYARPMSASAPGAPTIMSPIPSPLKSAHRARLTPWVKEHRYYFRGNTRGKEYLQNMYVRTCRIRRCIPDPLRGGFASSIARQPRGCPDRTVRLRKALGEMFPTLNFFGTDTPFQLWGYRP